MENRHYERPTFTFQELKLMERVADKCWGYSTVWYDANGDGIQGEGDIAFATSGGCQGSSSANELNKWAQENGIEKTFSPNASNTKEAGFFVPKS